LSTDKIKEDNNIVYNATSQLYHKVLENKFKQWENTRKLFIQVEDIGDISLFSNYTCICFYDIPSYHIHIYSDGSVDTDDNVDIETLCKQYELLKKLILKIT